MGSKVHAMQQAYAKSQRLQRDQDEPQIMFEVSTLATFGMIRMRKLILWSDFSVG